MKSSELADEISTWDPDDEVKLVNEDSGDVFEIEDCGWDGVLRARVLRFVGESDND